MAAQLVQDWTQYIVDLPVGEPREVQYKVYRNGDSHFQEIRDVNEEPIHTFELPDGLSMQPKSYEVLLRYVMLNVVNS